MAWSWSHTAEAIDNLEGNLWCLPDDTIRVIFAEWAAASNTDENSTHAEFDEELYALALEGSRSADMHSLRVKVWAEVEALRTCDNGGFEAWVCPFGCHTLPFDLIEKELDS